MDSENSSSSSSSFSAPTEPVRNEKRAMDDLEDHSGDTDSLAMCMTLMRKPPPGPSNQHLFEQIALGLVADIKRAINAFEAEQNKLLSDRTPPQIDEVEDLESTCTSCGSWTEPKYLAGGLCLGCIPKCNRCGMPNFWHRAPEDPALPFGHKDTCVICRKLSCPFYERCKQFKDRIDDKGCAQCVCKNCGSMFLGFLRPSCPTRRGWCVPCALKFACNHAGCSRYADPKLGDGKTCPGHYQPFCSISYCGAVATKHLCISPYRGYCNEHTVKNGRKRFPCCNPKCTSGLRAINGASSPCFECVCQVEGCNRLAAPFSRYCTVSHRRCPKCFVGERADHEEMCRDCRDCPSMQTMEGEERPFST